ncbi:MAG: hypothetical protein WCD44_04120 [Candidatus Babeliales bacterium]
MINRNKTLFFLVIFTIFTVNSKPKTKAVQKFTNILDKMQVVTANTKQYIEISPNGNSIKIFNTKTHECIAHYPIPNYIKTLLNKQNATKVEQEEANFACYHLGTKLKRNQQQSTKSIIEKIFSREHVQFTSIAIPVTLFSTFIKTPITKNSKNSPVVQWSLSLVFSWFVEGGFIPFTKNQFTRYYKKQDEETLKKLTFYNLGFYTADNYSHLLKKYPQFKQFFEEGRKEKKNLNLRNN